MSKTRQFVSLRELLSKSEERITLNPEETYREITVRLWGKGVVLRREVIGAEIGAGNRFIARHQQFILSRIDARSGASGLVPDSLDQAVVTNDFPVFNLNTEKLLPGYLELFSKTADFIELCKAASEGTTNRIRLKEERFLGLTIPLPPLEEQRCIVARIEELAAKIEEARGLRRKVAEETENLLAAELKQRREKLLNDGFQNEELGNLTQVTAGGTPSREIPLYWNGEIPWIKTGELMDGDIYEADEFITKEGLSSSSAKLFPPDTILIALYGQGQTRGRTGRLMIEATTNQACCAILPNASLLDSRFLQYWLRSLYNEMRRESRDGAQPNWNGQMIKRIKIALLPLEEQRRIVTYLDGLQAKVDALKRLQAETAAELDALLPSVLDRAFRGEL